MVMLAQEHKCVAFREIETPDRWIEFIKKDENILINLVIDEAYKGLRKNKSMPM